MITNKEKLEIYIGMLENLLEAQPPDSEDLQELSLEMACAIDLRDYPDEELEKDMWFQEHVLKELGNNKV